MPVHKALQNWSCWYTAEKLAELQALRKHLRKLVEIEAGNRVRKAFQKLFATNQQKATQLISGKQGQHGITALRSTTGDRLITLLFLAATFRLELKVLRNCRSDWGNSASTPP